MIVMYVCGREEKGRGVSRSLTNRDCPIATTKATHRTQLHVLESKNKTQNFSDCSAHTPIAQSAAAADIRHM